MENLISDFLLSAIRILLPEFMVSVTTEYSKEKYVVELTSPFFIDRFFLSIIAQTPPLLSSLNACFISNPESFAQNPNFFLQKTKQQTIENFLQTTTYFNDFFLSIKQGYFHTGISLSNFSDSKTYCGLWKTLMFVPMLRTLELSR